MLTRRELTAYLESHGVYIGEPERGIYLPNEVLAELHKMTAEPAERVYNINDITDFKKDHPEFTALDYLRLGSRLDPYFENSATYFIYHYNEADYYNCITLLDDDNNEPERLMLDQVARLLYDMELIDSLD